MKYLLGSLLVLAAVPAFAATSYVVPWYVNPVATNATYDASLVNDPDDAAVAVKITTAWSAVSGASALSGKTPLVKTMGDTSYFRPKFYVLCTDGDIVEFTMVKDLASAVWTNTLSAATLADAADASGAATDLKVSDDGRLAFLNYGGTWKALGYKPPSWTLHVLDSAGNEVADTTEAKRDYLGWIDAAGKRIYSRQDIQNGGSAYITDGKWQISIYNYYGGIGLGTHGDTTANAFRNGSLGEVLDLSAGTARYDGTDYSIRWNTEYALGAPVGGRTARVLIHSTKLETIQKIMGGWNNGYEEVVIDTDNIPNTGSGWSYPAQYGDGFWPSIKRLVLNIPNILPKQWGAFPYALSQAANITNAPHASESRWEDFNFSSVEYFNGASFKNFDCGGTLSLPVVTNLGNQAFSCDTFAHENTTPVEVLLSPVNKTLRIIGKQAFYRQSNIWRVVIGGHDDGVFFLGTGSYPQNFAELPNLKEVEFTGGLPSFEEPMGNWVFHGPSAKGMVFVIPREERWTSFIEGNFRVANDNEIRDYVAANPGRYVPFAVITNNALLHTGANQFVAYADSFGKEAPTTFAAEFNPGRGDVSTMVVGGNPPDELGRYEEGTVVRLTATPAAGFAFRRWYGDIGTNDATSAAIDVVMRKDLWIHARFTGGWTITGYDSTTRTAKATDGDFRINLSAMDPASHTFTLGDPGVLIGGLHDISYVENLDGSVTTNMLANSGTLDLGGDFILEGDATPWRATAFASGVGLGAFPIAYRDAVKTFISPGTITEGAKKALFNFDSSYKPCYTAFATVILDEPGMPGEINAYYFAGASRPVSSLALLIPAVGNLPDNALWNIQAASDLATWDLSSVSNITPKAMTSQWIVDNPTSYLKGRKAYNCYGSLSLPALRSVVRSDAAGSALSPMPYMTSLVLGGRTSADTVTSLCDGAFAGNSSMTNLTIHADANIVVGTGIFSDRAGYNGGEVVYSGHTPENMTFTGDAPVSDVFANLLAGVGAGDPPVLITTTRVSRGWLSKSYIDYNPSAAEKELAERRAGSVFGAYREGGVLKALFLWTEPPRGMMILFR